MSYRTPADSFLDDLRIASPCHEPWEAMNDVEGASRDRVRHCARCDLDVFNVSSMDREEAEIFVREREGERTCIRMFRRLDGTVITRDCPTAERARRRLPLAITAVATLASAFVGAGLGLRTPPKVRVVVPYVPASVFAREPWRGPVRAVESKGAIGVRPSADEPFPSADDP